MNSYTIKEILINNILLDEIYVQGNGNNFNIIAVSKNFSKMNRVEKQQTIYSPLMKYILNNTIHALSIQTYTPDEWQNIRKLNKF